MASIVEKLLEQVECGVCYERKELRLLPCQHRYCVQCLEGISTRGSFNCPECRLTYKQQAVSFPVCRLSRNMREQLTASIDSHEDKKAPYHSSVCQHDDCKKEVEVRCSKCEKFFCYRCLKRFPCGSTEKHQLEDLADVLSQYMVQYEGIKTGMEKELEELRCELKAKEEELKTKEHAAEAIKRMVDEEQNDLEKIHVIKDICQQIDSARVVQREDQQTYDSLSFEALYDYEGGELGTLPLESGETLTLLNQEEFHGWSTVENGSGDLGLVPTNYIRPKLPKRLNNRILRKVRSTPG